MFFRISTKHFTTEDNDCNCQQAQEFPKNIIPSKITEDIGMEFSKELRKDKIKTSISPFIMENHLVQMVCHQNSTKQIRIGWLMIYLKSINKLSSKELWEKKSI